MKGGKMKLRPYGWNLHPVYHSCLHVHKAFEKHRVMEDFMVHAYLRLGCVCVCVWVLGAGLGAGWMAI